MKILYLGEISRGQTARMRMRALERLGHEVCGVNTVEPWRNASWLRRQWQRRLTRGSIVDAINGAILAAARDFRPMLVWADKQEFLRIDTIRQLQKLGAKTVHFTPDPYFSLPWKRTALMDQVIRAFDVLIYSKSYEESAYESIGRPLIYMPLGFCDETHRPLRTSDSRWPCDVGFVGGWEPRREQLLHVVAATGVCLKVWGGYWEFLHDGRWTLRRQIILRQLAGREKFAIHRDAILAQCLRGGEVYSDDYAHALTGSRIGLGFLRQVCPDQHTTRTFEIPACGSMLLADRTAEHQEFFEEGKEAEYFHNAEELVEKVKYYSSREAARIRIADAGRQRCLDGRYAYIHRLNNVLNAMDKF